MSSPLLSVAQLRVAYGTSVVLDGISFELARGECVAVVGPSGSGKTSLGLGLVDLADPADVSGSVRWQGEEIRDRRSLRGREIGFVFQEPLSSLDPVRRVGDQVADVVRAHQGVDRREARRRAVALLERVHLPEPARRARQYPHQLSGGQRQRAAIAVALAGSPSLLIADEPTTALDAAVEAQILDLLGELRHELGLAVLLISHDPRVVERAADGVFQLGEPVTVDALPPLPAASSGPPLLVAESLVKDYGRVRVLDGVDLDVAPGETVALVGDSGAGKSTTARLLVAFERPTAGRVLFDGVDLALVAGRELRRLRRRFQLVFQDPWSSLNPRLSVGAALREAGATDVAALLASVGLSAEHARSFPHELSGGQRQRVAIARALAVDPEILVLDEPVSSLDAGVRGGILALLRRLQDERRLGMVFISHDVEVVQQMAHRVVALDRGRVA